MKDEELKDIAIRIQLDGWTGCALPLLRQIEIAALREARELVEKATVTIISDEHGSEMIGNPALPGLDRLIRDLELS